MSTSLVFCRICGSNLPVTPENTTFCCSAAKEAVLEEPQTHNRIRTPRINGTESTWDDVWPHLTSKVEAGRKIGLNTFGIYSGRKTFLRGMDWLESLLLSMHTGTTSWFTDLCLDDASRLLVTEWMIGHATPLLSDLGRTHNMLIVGDNPESHGWGLLQPDQFYTKEIKHSQQTKHTKVTFVNAEGFDPHISAQKQLTLRPGTEPFFLLGMLHLVLNNGWYDKQYVEKYTLGLDEIKQRIAPYTVSRCAKICGLSDADISGVTLKWVRSAMSLIHLTPGALRCENSTLGAWAWLTLHALSANALRPGGIYEAMGSLDLLPLFVGLRSENAPRSQVGGQPLLLGQNMSSQLLLEMERGNIETLLMLDNPIVAQPDRFMKAFKALPCSIVLSDVETPFTQEATIVLPRSTPWEERDILLHRNSQFAVQCLPTSGVLHPAFAESKSAAEVLNTVGQHLSFKWTGSDVGLTNRLLAKQVQKGGQEKWIQRAWGLLNEEDLDLNGSLNNKGEHDRALWRPSQDKIQLAPPALEELFRGVSLPKETERFPLFLHSSHTRGQTDNIDSITIEAHPDCGLTDGAQIELSTHMGSINGTLKLNSVIQPLAVLCSSLDHLSVGNLLPTNTDLHSGSPVFNGIPCAIKVL